MWWQKKSYDVICIGSASKDIFFPTAEGLVLETPEDITAKEKVAFELGGKYRVENLYEAVGGVSANVACGLARLGYSVASYSCIGNDEVGRYITEEFERERVSTDLLQRYDEAKSDLSAIIVLTQNGERTIFHNRDANERLQVQEDTLRGTRWVFVSALNGDWKTNFTTILETKKKTGILLALNPGQHNIKDDGKYIFEALSSIELLLLNKDEAIELLLQLTPTPSHEQLNDELFLLEKLHLAGASVIGMTDGKRGSWAYDGHEFWYCPIHTRNAVIDSTGAGDAFGSGFFAAHMKGESLSRALQYGMANSGSVVGFYGAISGLLTKEEMSSLVTKIIPKKLESRS